MGLTKRQRLVRAQEHDKVNGRFLPLSLGSRGPKPGGGGTDVLPKIRDNRGGGPSKAADKQKPGGGASGVLQGSDVRNNRGGPSKAAGKQKPGRGASGVLQGSDVRNNRGGPSKAADKQKPSGGGYDVRAKGRYNRGEPSKAAEKQDGDSKSAPRILQVIKPETPSDEDEFVGVEDHTSLQEDITSSESVEEDEEEDNSSSSEEDTSSEEEDEEVIYGKKRKKTAILSKLKKRVYKLETDNKKLNDDLDTVWEDRKKVLELEQENKDLAKRVGNLAEGAQQQEDDRQALAGPAQGQLEGGRAA